MSKSRRFVPIMALLYLIAICMAIAFMYLWPE